MLFDQLIYGRPGWQAEKPNTIELSLLAFNDGPDSVQSHPLREPTVKQIIELRELLRVLTGLFLRRKARLGALSNVLADPLFRRAHKPGALHSFERDPTDEAAALRQNIDQPVLRKPDQCLADGGAAGAEPQ